MSKPFPTARWAALALVLAAGCQRDGDDPAKTAASGDPAPQTSDDESAPDESAPDRAAPTVELLSAGTDPRRELRYALTPGSSEQVTIDLDMSMAVALGDSPAPPVELPRMQMVLDLAIEEDVGDAARYTFQISEASVLDTEGVDPTVARAIEQGLAQTVGTRGSAVVDERGFNRETRIDIPDGAPAETRQMMETAAQQMEQLSSPLPAEPVGQGARWEVVQHLEQNGISLVQTSVMTLESLDGDTGRLTASIRQDADPQTVEMPGAMQGATAELVELRSRGDGDISFDLARLMPARGEMHSKTESRFELDVGGGSAQPMSMQMDLSINLEGS